MMEAVLYTLAPDPKKKVTVYLMVTVGYTLIWNLFSLKKFSGINTKTHNQAHHYAAFGCRMLAPVCAALCGTIDVAFSGNLNRG